jgi:hypothetical protein
MNQCNIIYIFAVIWCHLPAVGGPSKSNAWGRRGRRRREPRRADGVQREPVQRRPRGKPRGVDNCWPGDGEPHGRHRGVPPPVQPGAAVTSDVVRTSFFLAPTTWSCSSWRRVGAAGPSILLRQRGSRRRPGNSCAWRWRRRLPPTRRGHMRGGRQSWPSRSWLRRPWESTRLVTTHSHPHPTRMSRIPNPPQPASIKTPLAPALAIPISTPAPNNPFAPAPLAGLLEIKSIYCKVVVM